MEMEHAGGCSDSWQSMETPEAFLTMPTAPELSICIPLFNKATYLERCFQHISLQGLDN